MRVVIQDKSWRRRHSLWWSICFIQCFLYPRNKKIQRKEYQKATPRTEIAPFRRKTTFFLSFTLFVADWRMAKWKHVVQLDARTSKPHHNSINNQFPELVTVTQVSFVGRGKSRFSHSCDIEVRTYLSDSAYVMTGLNTTVSFKAFSKSDRTLHTFYKNRGFLSGN